MNKNKEIAISQSLTISKAWAADGNIYTEGWLSTPDLDPEKHSIHPEAFIPVIDSYFARCAPLSMEHRTKGHLPVGHLQKAAIVRDGKIIKAAVHPKDSAEFEAFDNTGTGVYVRSVINDQEAGNAIQKGNVGCYSFIAAGRGEPQPDGSLVFKSLTKWIESTVTAYPVNPHAIMTLAKSYGYSTEDETTENQEDNDDMDQNQLENMLMQAVTKLSEGNVQKASKEEVDATISEALLKFKTEIDAEFKKALELERGQGQGRKLDNKPERSLETVIQKAVNREALTDEDNEDLWQVLQKALTLDMRPCDPSDVTVRFVN